MIKASMANRGRGINKETGMTTFLVTSVLIVVISLLVIAFSQVARRNEREALDRQLSTQAYYAAESGVNAAVSVIQANAAAGQPIVAKTTCPSNTDYPMPTLDTGNVDVACSIVTPTVDNLVYTGVTAGSPTIAAATSTTGANLSTITLTWRSPLQAATATACPDNFSLPSTSSWACAFGLLRVDVATPPNGSVTTANTYLFKPIANASSGSSTVIYGSATSGQLAKGRCVVSGTETICTATITGLNAPTYYLSLRSLYRDSTVTINATNIAGTAVQMKGQVVVDVTGRAQDVMRRVQVRVPLVNRQSADYPSDAIQTTDSLCKRFMVAPNYSNTDYTNEPSCQ